MSTRSDVLMWAQRVVGRKNPQPHELLGIAACSGIETAQAAFHKMAQQAHPDLHRTGLSAEELELVTTAYAIVAGAYQQFRTKSGADRDVPVTPSGAAPTANAAQSMSSKALVYYRKAESSLRSGDLKGALLQLKMAIAADPQSPFLRTAIAEVESEVRKIP